MGENALDEKGILDTGDDVERTAAATTVLDVDGEDAFETLHPAHAHVFGEGLRVGLLAGAVSPSAEIYWLTLPLTRRIHLTRIHANISGDTVFPALDISEWREIERTEHPADERHAYPMTFSTLERRPPDVTGASRLRARARVVA